MDPVLSQQEISELSEQAAGNLNNHEANRIFICYMAGYMRMTAPGNDEMERARQTFFTQLKKLLPTPEQEAVEARQNRFKELWDKWNDASPDEKSELLRMQEEYWKNRTEVPA